MKFSSENIEVDVEEDMRCKSWPFYRANNEELSYAYYESEELEKQIQALDAETRTLCKLFLQKKTLLHRLHATQRDTKYITLDHEGVLIHQEIINSKEGEEAYEYWAVDQTYENYNPAYPRTARVYRNRHNNKTWGLSLDIKKQQIGVDRNFQGSHFKNKNEVIAKALDWVAIKGILSPY